MGKKRSRKAKTSKGIHSSIDKGIVHAVKTSTSVIDRHWHKIVAWKKGKNPWLTVPTIDGPKKVRANSVYGNPKSRYNIFLSRKAN